MRSSGAATAPPFPVEYSANPLIEDGQISGMVVAFQDVSERRRLEKMKDEFISTVSHELRTPLTSLRASLGLISSGTLDKRPEKQRQMIDMAIGNCDRLIRLVNDILDFDSVERGKLPLNRQPVEAIDLLRRAADVAHTSASQAHIDFRIEAPQAQVLADEERILQVLNELVANAIKFSPPETQIRLAAQPCRRKSKSVSSLRIRAAASPRRNWSTSSIASSRATPPTPAPWAAPASAWPSAAASSSSTAAASGLKARPARAAASSSPSPPRQKARQLAQSFFADLLIK